MRAEGRAVSEETLFEQALSRPATEREGFLTRECPDPVLRARVMALLAANAAQSPIDPRSDDTAQPPPRPIDTGSYHSESAESAGTVIAGKYTLVEPIGEGGMGSVWRAKQTEPVKRFVAIKLIKAGMDSRQVLARFDAERQALAMMDHPNIAKVLDGGLHDHRPFFAMELVKGVPITEFCDSRKLTPRVRLELFVSVCQAIQHAHQKGIIHRDIKPTNVLVALYDDKPVVKVIDFGVAKATGGALTEHTIDTGFGGVVGTPQYMSPEQATFNNLDIDTRSDIYSLGVLLYELLTGSPPFTKKELEKKGLMEILRVVREEEPPRPSTKLSTADALPSLSANRGTEPKRLTGMLRSELDWVVMKALEKDRARRYESANGFAADVLRYLGGEAVFAHPPSAAYRLKKLVRRNKGRVAAAGVVAVSLVAGIIGTSLAMVEARRQEGLAVAAKEHAEEQRRIAEGERDEKEKARQQAVAEKQRADREKAIAEAVKTFVTQDVFGRAGDKALGPSAEIKAGTLLVEAAKTVGAKFLDQPEVELEVRYALARGFLHVGNTNLAVEQGRRVLELCRAHKPPDDPVTLIVLRELATARVDFKESLAWSQESFEGFRRNYGDEDVRTIEAANAHAWVIHTRKPAEASRILDAFLPISKRVLGESDPKTLALKTRKALLLSLVGKHEEALAIHREVRDAYEKSQTELSSRPQEGTWHFIAGSLMQMGRYDAAIPLFQDDIARLSKVLGADHAEVTYRRSGLANAYWFKGDDLNAGPAMFDVVEGDRRTYGPRATWALEAQRRAAVALARVNRQDIAVARAEAWAGSDRPNDLAHAASLYCQITRVSPGHARIAAWRDRAMELFRRAVDRGWNDAPRMHEFAEISGRADFRAVIDQMSKGNPSVQLLGALAASHRKRRRFDDAVKLFREVIALQRGAIARNPADEEPRESLGNLLDQLGQTLSEQGRADDAIAAHREAYEVRSGLFAASTSERKPEFGTQAAWSLHNQARVLLEIRRFEEAAALYDAAAAAREKLIAAHPAEPRYPSAASRDLDWLGRTWERAGEWAKSEAAYRRALALREAMLAGDPDNTENRTDVDWSRQRLADVLMEQRKFAEASVLHRANVELLRRTNESGVHDALVRYGIVLLELKAWAEAADVLKECLERRERQIPTSVMTFSTRSLLGEAYTGLKRYQDAGPLLLKGYEDLKANESRIPPAGASRIPRALDRLIAFHEATGDAAAAAKYRELRKRYPEPAPPPREKK
jgi:serine/threonine protein kinase/tetratricopeptide (TPR) repeat protein